MVLTLPSTRLARPFQVLATEVADYSKRVFDDGMQAREQLLGVKSFDQAIKIHSEYANAKDAQRNASS
jgi:hypothetical protein